MESFATRARMSSAISKIKSNHHFSYNFNFNTQFTSSTYCKIFHCLFPASFCSLLSPGSAETCLFILFPRASSLRLFNRDATNPSGAPSEDLEGHQSSQLSSTVLELRCAYSTCTSAAAKFQRPASTAPPAAAEPTPQAR